MTIIYLTQISSRLITHSGLTDTQIATTPMELNLHLQLSDGMPLADPSRYHKMVDSLVYLTITRPDTAHAIHILSQFVSAPTLIHYAHLLHLLRYLFKVDIITMTVACLL